MPSTDGVLGGEPRLDGRRISVLQVVEPVLDAGRSPDSVAEQLDVPLADVHAALAYYYANPEEMDEVRARHEELEATLAERSTPPSRPDP